MRSIDRHLQEQGAAGEAQFRDWLDASRLPYIYVDQTQETVPEHFRSTMKRPDFLVALPFVGAIAFDTKVKTVYGPTANPYFVFDVAEIRRLAVFDRLFRVTTFLACQVAGDSAQSTWFQVEDIMLAVGRRRRGTVQVHLGDGLDTRMSRPFQEALRDLLVI
ncbi:hypothetical protein [Methyloraptor flagellatus]|uniref:Uncharacterized protein n=1 Tax=Methyloraptor flagellatus TaxID=3162530 RepID=A0AAU7XJ72_9HYPH